MMKKWSIGIVLGLVLVVILLYAGIRSITYHPDELESVAVQCKDAPLLSPGQKIKVMSYNVQFMAGKSYVFFFDVPGHEGPDERPSAEDIDKTLDRVARIIRLEDPDIILLQEMDKGAKRTDYQDQTQLLIERLPDKSYCYTSAFYWKAKYVPHPRIRGAVGMRLVTLSKYRIDKATRHQLPLVPGNWLVQQFNIKRAILETQMPITDGRMLSCYNVHLEAFTEGTDVAEQQVAMLQGLLQAQTRHWIAGGDYNLLPPGHYEWLDLAEKEYYRPDTEIKRLYDLFPGIPPTTDLLDTTKAKKWFTHNPNNPQAQGPDKTIDYFFYSPDLKVDTSYVRHHDTLDISDHLPLIGTFIVPQ